MSRQRRERKPLPIRRPLVHLRGDVDGRSACGRVRDGGVTSTVKSEVDCVRCRGVIARGELGPEAPRNPHKGLTGSVRQSRRARVIDAARSVSAKLGPMSAAVRFGVTFAEVAAQLEREGKPIHRDVMSADPDTIQGAT